MSETKNILSIVIPTYNVEKYIGNLLEGFGKQTNENWEVLIIDDGSTDETEKIVKRYVSKDSRFHFFKRDRLPKGAQTCRNIGIKKAQGKYISIIDADDLIAPYFVKQRVDFMEKNPEIDYATFKGKSIYKTNEEQFVEGKLWGEKTDDDLLRRFLKADYPYGIWNNIYKAVVPKNVKFDEKVKVYQDFDFIARTLLLDYKHAFAENSQPDYFYRQGHSGTITSNFINNQKYESTKYLFNKISRLLIESGRKEYITDFFDFYILQYKRVFLSGSKKQVEDFKKYINLSYKKTLKVNVASLLLCNGNTNNKIYIKKVHLVFGILFNLQNLLNALKLKVNSKL